MQYLSGTLEGFPCFQGRATGCQAQVRFVAYHRIKPHDPPLVRPPVYSFEFEPCGCTPQAVHLTLLLFRTPLEGSILPIASAHCLRRGLRGYLIRFAPHAFVPERQACSSGLLSLSTFLPISALFTTTPGIPSASYSLKSNSFGSRLQVKPEGFTTNLLDRLRTL